jgi:ketosteroid isomerase-like protein
MVEERMKRGMRYRILTAASLLLLLGATSAFGQTKPTKDAKAIQAVLDTQVAAWNRGDIEGFMEGYEHSEKTVFVGGDNVTRGWQTVLDRYKRNYDSREKMGTLTFSDLEITPLGNGSALVLMRWHLQRAKDEPHGRSTLIMRRTKQGWKIVHDHSSAA